MRKLFLDIETLPADENSYQSLRLIYNKRKEKNPDYRVDFEQFLLGTSFDGAFGRILCIGYASNNEPVQVLCHNKNEAETLRQFWVIAQNHELFIGHNIMDFDLRFIYQRSIINKVKPTKELNFARYRNSPIFDTMKEWVKWANCNVGLEHLALALGLPTPKQDIDGSQVFDFYKQGKIGEILKYCQRDVETTRTIYKRMIFES